MLESALIHRARLVGWERSGARNAQGEYPQVAVSGPWIAARVMERGGASAKTRGAGASTEARVSRAYELLLAAVDESGALIEIPTASATFETDCPVLGNPTIPLDGEPEVLNNGQEIIGFLAYGGVALERS